jgi:hypothetical protein
MRVALAARMGLPLGNHVMHGGLPYYPLPTTLDANEYGNNLESSVYISKHMQFLEQQTGHPQMLISGLYPGAPITDSQVFTSIIMQFARYVLLLFVVLYGHSFGLQFSLNNQFNWSFPFVNYFSIRLP